MSDQGLAGEDMPWWPGTGREGAMARLVALDGQGELTTAHARLVAGALGVSLRTVWNWVAVARGEGRLSARTPDRPTVTPELRARLAVWGGNVAAVHRELVAESWMSSNQWLHPIRRYGAATADPVPEPAKQCIDHIDP
ncbi:hypothetical protein OG311_40390 (plasmid) [Streptomyces sp. NBC_01343]|uniref:hypothetical protein n=1 Tax=Streptomyces sp. NBC_01343 TaxID=2903832 RepID=UPI002E12A14D|nr:hypothetical protein OG311_40390 [Streptomyces sp. NBC_01343]